MRKADQAPANEQIRDFIIQSIPKKGEGAKF
jgi:hypothetical protein